MEGFVRPDEIPAALLRARLRSFEVRNFRVIKHERLIVHPDVTAIVGRNDVGKSTLLKAIELYGWVSEGGFRDLLLENDDIAGSGESATRFTAEWEAAGKIFRHSLEFDTNAPVERLECEGAAWTWHPLKKRLETSSGTFTLSNGDTAMSLADVESKRWRIDAGVPRDLSSPLSVTRAFQTPIAYLFEPSALSRDAPVKTEYVARNGRGWAIWLQEILSRRNEDIGHLEEEIRKLFPHFRSIQVKKQNATRLRGEAMFQVVVTFSPSSEIPELRGTVHASSTSSGLLLALAHFALSYATPEGSLLLIEEPENGLNAKITFDMIKAFLRVIRERKQQLIFTTHNEWWLDLVEPESIRVLTRDSAGAHIHAPAKERIRRLLEESDLHPSEIMSTFGPEGLLYEHAPER
jgi:predicted ATPase